MRFDYKQLGPSYYRPIIPITLKNNDKEIKFEVLVDSGADFNIIDAQFAEYLEVDLKDHTKDKVHGITGKGEFYYKSEIEIGVGGIFYKAPVGFLPNMKNNSYGIVGQIGFFDHFDVKFMYRKKMIDIVPKFER